MSDNNKVKNNNNNIQENTIITPYNHSEKDLLLNPEMNYIDNPLHIIGPLYIVGGCIGIISGIVKSYKDIYYFPKIINNNSKIKISKYLSEIINHSNHLSNTFGSFGLVNYFVSKSMDLIIQETKIIKIPKLINNNKFFNKLIYNKNNNLLRNFSQGFFSGSIFKCHHGIKTSLISGAIFGNSFLLLSFILNKKKINI